MVEYKQPKLTVDVIIELEDQGIVLIERKNEPHGWALPGGYVDYGETLEHAAARESKEETCLDVELVRQFHVYSDPKRDPRFHVVTVVFHAKASGTPKAADDAKSVKVFRREDIPRLVFDHSKILDDYFSQSY